MQGPEEQKGRDDRAGEYDHVTEIARHITVVGRRGGRADRGPAGGPAAEPMPAAGAPARAPRALPVQSPDRTAMGVAFGLLAISGALIALVMLGSVALRGDGGDEAAVRRQLVEASAD